MMNSNYLFVNKINLVRKITEIKQAAHIPTLNDSSEPEKSGAIDLAREKSPYVSLLNDIVTTLVYKP